MPFLAQNNSPAPGTNPFALPQGVTISLPPLPVGFRSPVESPECFASRVLDIRVDPHLSHRVTDADPCLVGVKNVFLLSPKLAHLAQVFAQPLHNVRRLNQQHISGPLLVLEAELCQHSMHCRY